MNCYIHTVLFETKNMIKVLSRVCVLHVLSSRVMFHAAALFCSSDVKQKRINQSFYAIWELKESWLFSV